MGATRVSNLASLHTPIPLFTSAMMEGMGAAMMDLVRG